MTDEIRELRITWGFAPAPPKAVNTKPTTADEPDSDEGKPQPAQLELGFYADVELRVQQGDRWWSETLATRRKLWPDVLLDDEGTGAVDLALEHLAGYWDVMQLRPDLYRWFPEGYEGPDSFWPTVVETLLRRATSPYVPWPDTPSEGLRRVVFRAADSVTGKLPVEWAFANEPGETWGGVSVLRFPSALDPAAPPPRALRVEPSAGSLAICEIDKIDQKQLASESLVELGNDGRSVKLPEAELTPEGLGGTDVLVIAGHGVPGQGPERRGDAGVAGDAVALLRAVRQAHPGPGVVVVASCGSGASSAALDPSYAELLAQGRVPVVIGYQGSKVNFGSVRRTLRALLTARPTASDTEPMQALERGVIGGRHGHHAAQPVVFADPSLLVGGSPERARLLERRERRTTTETVWDVAGQVAWVVEPDGRLGRVPLPLDLGAAIQLSVGGTNDEPSAVDWRAWQLLLEYWPTVGERDIVATRLFGEEVETRRSAQVPRASREAAELVALARGAQTLLDDDPPTSFVTFLLARVAEAYGTYDGSVLVVSADDGTPLRCLSRTWPALGVELPERGVALEIAPEPEWAVTTAEFEAALADSMSVLTFAAAQRRRLEAAARGAPHAALFADSSHGETRLFFPSRVALSSGAPGDGGIRPPSLGPSRRRAGLPSSSARFVTTMQVG